MWRDLARFGEIWRDLARFGTFSEIIGGVGL